MVEQRLQRKADPAIKLKDARRTKNRKTSMTPVTEAARPSNLRSESTGSSPLPPWQWWPKPTSCASQGIDVVDFGAGEPHFSTPQHIKDAAIAAIQNNFTKYTAVGGTAELRDAIVLRHAADFQSDYRREESMASVGGKHALFNAIQVLVDHGDEVILPVPYWVSFKDIVRYAGGKSRAAAGRRRARASG